ncbi:restriction endonuclease subunit S [Sulfitobacter sp. R18_1]|uniref:restriction endonuclease subunit S n=1 Tax=Sulfitobacter sp. R18_1 TaxID=2821104 RepID=UPI001AD999EA|nr:restriction endonuclease subunit S [Sulfitobacter sp. R18_1]MBO9429605.1 restriction endonuclease subunit S [Sulfitobacter sp. R18_1]
MNATSIRFEALPLAFVGRNKGGVFIDGDWIESKDLSDHGIKYLTTGNVGVGTYKEQGSGYISEETFSKLRCTEVYPGDILVSRLNLPVGRACIVPDLKQRLVTSVDNVIVRPSDDFDRRYLVFLLSTPEHLESASNLARGTTMQRISRSALGRIRLSIPDLPTQKRIAAFLDRETARVDELIAKKERLVEVLKESLLSELERLVTPAEHIHEELIPFRWVCRITEGQVDPTHPDWAAKPLIAPNHIESKTGRLLGTESAADQGAISGKYAFPAGTVLYSKIRPNLAKACVSPVEGMCSADMYPVLPDRRLRPQFLLMQLLSAKFTDWATLESMRVAMPKINRETLGSYRLWAPSLSVQDEAAVKFFAEQNRTEALTDKVRTSIDRLREYRAALITAAVTGQIDVDTYGKAGTTSETLDRIEEEMQA